MQMSIQLAQSQCVELSELLIREGWTLSIKLRSTQWIEWFSSVQFSGSVMSDSLRPHESQHARPPCPTPIPEFTQTHVHRVSDAIQPSHPLSSPSPLAPNPSQPQSFFPMSQLFAWGGHSTGVSSLASFLPKKSQGWSPSEWTGWISLQSKGLSRVFPNFKLC